MIADTMNLVADHPALIASVHAALDGPQGEEFASRLEVVEIGLDDDGDKITSCVIVPVEGGGATKRKAKKTSGGGCQGA